MEKGQSWKLHLMVAIEDCMALARSRQDFIRRMKRRGYGVRWEDGRKYITYTTPGGMRCRDNKLHEMKFRKEKMEYELRIRAEILRRLKQQARQQSQAAGKVVPCVTVTEKNWAALLSLQQTQLQLLEQVLEAQATLATQWQMEEFLQSQTEELTGLRPEVPGSLTEFPELLEGVGEGGGEEAIHTGWEDQRSIFLEAVLQPEESGQSRQGLFWISLIPTAFLVLLEVMRHIFPLT